MSNVNFECPNQTMISESVMSAIACQINNAIDMVGFPITIYYPVNELEQLNDVYNVTPKTRFKGPYETRIWINWNPSMKQLKNFGIFTEEDNPIIVYLKTREELPAITTNLLVRVKMGFEGGVEKYEYFQLVSQLIKAAYNSVVVSAWTMAPARFNIKALEIVSP